MLLSILPVRLGGFFFFSRSCAATHELIGDTAAHLQQRMVGVPAAALPHVVLVTSHVTCGAVCGGGGRVGDLQVKRVRDAPQTCPLATVFRPSLPTLARHFHIFAVVAPPPTSRWSVRDVTRN